MKIYCSTSFHDIEDFIGTDLWVRMLEHGFERDTYVKMARTFPAYWDKTIEMIEFYTMDARIFDMLAKEKITNTDLQVLYGYYHYKYHTQGDDLGLPFFLQKYSLIEPIEVLTDEEIQSCFEEVCKMYMWGI